MIELSWGLSEEKTHLLNRRDEGRPSIERLGSGDQKSVLDIKHLRCLITKLCGAKWSLVIFAVQ